MQPDDNDNPIFRSDLLQTINKPQLLGIAAPPNESSNGGDLHMLMVRSLREFVNRL
ncbi:hypothetical protein JXL21_12000 [Candidatus Bathyarchaeota archaeon]|nr:hypothetical protein [Candidatus Bathyarchaeota archaeon]